MLFYRIHGKENTTSKKNDFQQLIRKQFKDKKLSRFYP